RVKRSHAAKVNGERTGPEELVGRGHCHRRAVAAESEFADGGGAVVVGQIIEPAILGILSHVNDVAGGTDEIVHRQEMILIGEIQSPDPALAQIRKKVSIEVLRWETGSHVPRPADRAVAFELIPRYRRARVADVGQL